MPKRQTPTKKQLFLEAIERGLTVTTAAEHAGVDRTTPYVWEQEDEKFQERWQKARDRRLPQLKDTAFDIALEGDKGMLKFLIDRYEPDAHHEQQPIREIEILFPGEGESDDNHDFITFG